jgi:Phosphotransferase enzyme family
MLPTPKSGGCSQPAGDGFQGGTDTSHTGFTLRERLAQPQPCTYGAASREAAFKAVHQDIPPQATRTGSATFIPIPEGAGSFARSLDLNKAQDVLSRAFTAAAWTIEKPQDGRQKECYIASDGTRNVFIKFDVPIKSLERLGELGVAPHVLASGTYRGERYVIQEFLAGTYPDRPWITSHINEVAALIATYHDDRPLAEILAQGEHLRYRQHIDHDLAMLETKVAAQAAAPLQPALRKLKALSASFDDGPLVPVHNEPNTKNMLVHAGKLTFIDWDEVLLCDPLRDIGVLVWWYLPMHQCQDFFRSYGAPLTPAAEAKIYWFAARASLAICLWHLAHGHPMGGFYNDFLAALNLQPNPHAS